MQLVVATYSVTNTSTVSCTVRLSNYPGFMWLVLAALTGINKRLQNTNIPVDTIFLHQHSPDMIAPESNCSPPAASMVTAAQVCTLHAGLVIKQLKMCPYLIFSQPTIIIVQCAYQTGGWHQTYIRVILDGKSDLRLTSSASYLTSFRDQKYSLMHVHRQPTTILFANQWLWLTARTGWCASKPSLNPCIYIYLQLF